jgi:hypothetical protein
MRPRLRLVSAIVAFMAAISLAAPVAASSPWQTFKQTGANAFAFTQTCEPNTDGTTTCVGQSLDIFEGTIKESGLRTRKGEIVCYNEFEDTFDPFTGEGTSRSLFGCAEDPGTVTVNGLTSVTLAPTLIELTVFECDSEGCTETPDGSTTVQGVWTGVGPITTHKGKFKFDDGTCIEVNADKGRFRAASFDGSVDADEASIGEGTFTFRTSCPF